MIQITNTLSGKKEPFQPKQEGVISMYMCGPTVYGYTHIGNARAALTGDLVVRTFEYAGYKVLYARNVTDIDDKIIKKAQDENRDWTSVTAEFDKAYEDEMLELEIRQPNFKPHATQHVKGITTMVDGLIKKGLAYESETPFGKDVYYRVEKFEFYGKLSGRKLDDMQAGARVEVGEAKENPMDFALWKAAKPGEPSWKSPWGDGRPGWHIECSAMIYDLFPEGIDLHLGGADLIFPHHENEIAQSEGFTGKTLANFWLHNGMLTIQREKMSKSLGNVFLTSKFMEQFGPETLKLMMLQHHYRSPIDFSDEAVLRTEGLVERLYKCKELALTHAKAEGTASAALEGLHEKLKLALFDDFNSAKALGFVLKAIRDCHKSESPADWKAWGENCLGFLNKGLGILTQEPAKAIQDIRARRLKRLNITDDVANRVEGVLKERENMRKNKQFEEADRLRKDLEAEGFLIMDGPDGSAWSVQR